MTVVALWVDRNVETWPGVGIVAFFSVAVALLAFVGRTRLPGTVVGLMLGLCGAGIGVGAGLIDSVTYEGVLNTTEHGRQWLASVVIIGALTPVHVRVLFGPLGRKE